MGRCSLTCDCRGKCPSPANTDPRSEGGWREGSGCRGWQRVDGGLAGWAAGPAWGPQHGVWRRPHVGSSSALTQGAGTPEWSPCDQGLEAGGAPSCKAIAVRGTRDEAG